MNKFYVIAPIVLLGAFIFYYSQFSAQEKIKQEQRAEAAAEKATLDQEAKEEATKKAAAEAQVLQQKQRDEDEHAEQEREQKFQNDLKAVTDETNKYKDEADELAQQTATLQTQLDSLQAAHEKASIDLFNLQKKIELEKVARRDADMEIERTYDMVTQKVAASSLANYTPPPAPAQ
ncbi:MAG: hypothetical protein ABSE59_00765 [Opitutaceae bacterium]|jgi:preprotein translocase subunit SecF